jgi:hypothetical protein
MKTEKIEGGCLCGAVRYHSEGKPINIRACHCRRCQKATGAPLYARVMVPRDSVTMKGPVGRFDAGTGVIRGFCKECGTSLFTERPAAGGIGLSFGSLDDPDLFAPAEHIWWARRQAWLMIDDDLPHHLGNPPV